MGQSFKDSVEQHNLVPFDYTKTMRAHAEFRMST